MIEQFRVAQKIGLMFRPSTPIPQDIKTWAISQLHADSPALGISTKFGIQAQTASSSQSNNLIRRKIESWPQSMQPDLEERARIFRLLQGNYIKTVK